MTIFRRLCLGFLILYWATILTLTHIPPDHVPDVGMNDKVEHLGAYGLLAGALFVTLWLYKPGLKNLWLIVLLVGMAYGAFDEWTQPIFGRDCELGDWFADSMGTAIAAVVLTSVRPWIDRRSGGASGSSPSDDAGAPVPASGA